MIQIDNLTKRYGETVILDSASYTFPQTGMVCLMGASGGGKTTLLNLLAGFDTDYTGGINVGGIALNGLDGQALCDYRRDYVGFVFQNYHLLYGYTVLENVLLAGELNACTDDERLQKAEQLLERLGLAEKMSQRAETLSGGQKQRVAIARALMGDPQVIFADEPTGALDHKTSTEIMALLQEISADRLVVVITHDAKIAEFAAERIKISGQQIVVEQSAPPTTEQAPPLVTTGGAAVYHPFSRSRKNFRVHFKRYLAVSLVISIGLLAFLFSLSFGNIMEQSIAAFEQKNTAFNSGYLRGADDGTLLAALQADDRISTAYYQYRINDVTLSLYGKTVDMAEKFPGAKATESLSYGVMPRQGANEIAITPSLAKKFSTNIQALIGKTLNLKHNGTTYALTISGIFNAGYDDFFVSMDVEQQLYNGIAQGENYAITYEVRDFADIVAVSDDLLAKGLEPQTAAEEVSALQSTFKSLNKLFLIISILVLVIGLFICSIILFKLQNSRYHEVGLLSALGYGKSQISSMITLENVLLSTLATAINLVLLCLSITVCHVFALPFAVGGVQVILTVIGTFAIVLALSGLASYKLLRTEPAEALRK